jgi:hypothetical protein
MGVCNTGIGPAVVGNHGQGLLAHPACLPVRDQEDVSAPYHCTQLQAVIGNATEPVRQRTLPTFCG